MILIASAAYVTTDFQVELGKIPPCLLPIGNKKLIELQYQSLIETFADESISVSLPESYNLSESEQKLFDNLKIDIIFVPDAFSLAESLLYVINTSEYLYKDDTFYLLHGDTYISDFSLLKFHNILAVSQSIDSYNWEVVRSMEDHALVWSGFFNFSSIGYLLKALTLNKYNFPKAIKFYNDKYYLENIEINNWYDLGHAYTYFSTRAKITTQRAFNELKIKDGIVYKSGNPSIKIEAEAKWFENVPYKLKKYIPVLLEHGNKNDQYYYCLEYLPYIPLNELFVHGKNELLQWNNIFEKLKTYLKCSQIEASNEQKESIDNDLLKLYSIKSKERFLTYLEQKNISIDEKIMYKNKILPSLSQILEECITRTTSLDAIYGIMHGDLCFSNILFDSRGDRIKVIDPRGLSYDNNFTIFGDLKYDFAKLTHSVIGYYDFIISGHYKIIETSSGSLELIFDIDKRIENISNHFYKSFIINELHVKEILPLVILLFFSMLPLHSDRPDRQKVMFYNALRLYYEYML
ncbi:hypothetical protein GCM10023206_18860 [Acinetobacter puyangensis]|uniref:Phosphotransferase enzyme family protein n=1 Tax=Acinetobacter puyangensis TaxID=1096779 RepID=A0A240E5I3_9GAMM|nr:hypothetical protein [Acinetobacter puyangensis]SNX43852.1 hypothetical protein SAMN05421731_1028 [Acinetobacter puyangensis]